MTDAQAIAQQLDEATTALQGDDAQRDAANRWLVAFSGESSSKQACALIIEGGLARQEASYVTAAGIVAAAAVRNAGSNAAARLLELAAKAPAGAASRRLADAACEIAVADGREGDVVRALMAARAGDFELAERVATLRFSALEALAAKLSGAAAPEELFYRPGAKEGCAAAAQLVEAYFFASANAWPADAGRLLAAWAECGLLTLNALHRYVLDRVVKHVLEASAPAAEALRRCVEASLAAAEAVDGDALAAVGAACCAGCAANAFEAEDLGASAAAVVFGVLECVWDDAAWFQKHARVGESLLGAALQFLAHASPVVGAVAADGVARVASSGAPWKVAFCAEAWDRALACASFRRVRENDFEDDGDLRCFRDRDLCPLFYALGDALGGAAIDAKFPTVDGLRERGDYERVEAALFAAACLSDDAARRGEPPLSPDDAARFVCLRDGDRRRVDLRLPPSVVDDPDGDPLAYSLAVQAEVCLFRSAEVVSDGAALRAFDLAAPPALPGMKRRGPKPDLDDEAPKAKAAWGDRSIPSR